MIDSKISNAQLASKAGMSLNIISEKENYQRIFTESYFQLIISDEDYAKQLWCLGNAYAIQKSNGNENYLLGSIVVFQSRGSITATQGHIPESILRGYMSEWGLTPGEDFNLQDVEIGDFLGEVETAAQGILWREKKRDRGNITDVM